MSSGKATMIAMARVLLAFLSLYLIVDDISSYAGGLIERQGRLLTVGSLKWISWLVGTVVGGLAIAILVTVSGFLASRCLVGVGLTGPVCAPRVLARTGPILAVVIAVLLRLSDVPGVRLLTREIDHDFTFSWSGLACLIALWALPVGQLWHRALQKHSLE